MRYQEQPPYHAADGQGLTSGRQLSGPLGVSLVRPYPPWQPQSKEADRIYRRHRMRRTTITTRFLGILFILSNFKKLRCVGLEKMACCGEIYGNRRPYLRRSIHGVESDISIALTSFNGTLYT